MDTGGLARSWLRPLLKSTNWLRVRLITFIFLRISRPYELILNILLPTGWTERPIETNRIESIWGDAMRHDAILCETTEKTSERYEPEKRQSLSCPEAGEHFFISSLCCVWIWCYVVNMCSIPLVIVRKDVKRPWTPSPSDRQDALSRFHPYWNT